MFFDKLWLRIRGELLTLKEDGSETEDLRTKAGRLLDRVQERVIGGQENAGGTAIDDHEASHARYEDVTEGKRRELAGVEAPSRKTADDRDPQKDSDEDNKPLPPNPRQLG